MTLTSQLPDGIDREVIDVVRRFVASEVTPVAGDHERAGRSARPLVPRLGEVGVLGAGLDEQYGGTSVNEATRARIAEELGYGWSSLAGTVTTQWFAAGLIARFGTDEQRERWLPSLAAGTMAASISLSEPDAGTDTSALSCRATPDEAGFVIDGTKAWVTNGAVADVIVLAARSPEGISAFVIDAQRARAAGTLVASEPFHKLGNLGSDVVEMRYVGHRVGANDVLGGPATLGRGQRMFLERMDLGRLHVAGIALGIARASLDQALEYAAVRQTFGKTIDQHQAIQFKLADMATCIRGAQLHLDDAAARFDAGEKVTLEAAMAKLVCTEAALATSRDALRIHAGIGYVRELSVERQLRDAALYVIGEGTNEIQHVLIARQLKERAGLRR